MTQADFAIRLNLTRAAICNYESGTRTLSDRTIADICREFNVNEIWLRTGEGDIFVQPESFSLDEFAKAHDASDLDLEIAKAYFEMPPNLRHSIVEHFQHYFCKEKASPELPIDDDIEREVEAYRQMLIAERKGGN